LEHWLSQASDVSQATTESSSVGGLFRPRTWLICRRNVAADHGRAGGRWFVGRFTTSTGRIVALSNSRCSRGLSPRRFLPNLHPVECGGVFFVISMCRRDIRLGEPGPDGCLRSRIGSRSRCVPMDLGVPACFNPLWPNLNLPVACFGIGSARSDP
jgi:hypothetical protein